MFSYIIQSTVFVSAIFVTGLIAKNILPITIYLWDFINLPHGTGRVYSRKNRKTKKKKIYVNTSHGKINLQYIKLPNPDTEIYFLKTKDIYLEDKFMSKELFNELYNKNDYVGINTYELGIIPDIIRTKEFNGKNIINGFITTPWDDYVYMFKIKDELIDYEKIFENYEDAIDNMDKNKSTLNDID